jgi:hypothetical protein
MPSKKYEIYVKGILSFVKYTRQEFDRICSDLDRLNVNYEINIIHLI